MTTKPEEDKQTKPTELLSPKTSVLICTRLRAHSTRLLCSQNINADVEGRIVTTLLKLENNSCCWKI